MAKNETDPFGRPLMGGPVDVMTEAQARSRMRADRAVDAMSPDDWHELIQAKQEADVADAEAAAKKAEVEAAEMSPFLHASSQGEGQ